jgi:CRISPR-associated endonuclease Csn1
MNKNISAYNIGLDIGTGSVGYAATDQMGNNLKIKGKNMWGVRLFDGADTAASTRASRGMRRRYDRRRQRIELLRHFFADSGEIDTDFFDMIDCSFLNEEVNEYNLFNDIGLNDKSYYNRFKTIYHLRSYLQNCEEKADIRLLYLAIHHIVKYRGNFLHEDNPNLSSENAGIEDSVKQLFSELEIAFEKQYNSEIIENITNIIDDDSLTRSEKSKELGFLLGNDSFSKNLVKAFIGYKFNASAIFEPDSEKNEFKITDDEKYQSFISSLDESFVGVAEALFNLNSAITLKSILTFEKGKSGTLSDAMINKYNAYGEDLSDLKKLIRKYYNNEYKWMFGQKPCITDDNRIEALKKSSILFSYALNEKTYTGYNTGVKKCSLDDLYKTIKSLFIMDGGNYPYSNDECFIRMSQRMENEDFLKKINSTDNGAIPYQLHLEELKNIINNQGKYYPFLLENKDKICSIVSFRLPYWCGPLNAEKNPDGSRQFAWSVRKKKDEKVYPWNFESVIDVDKTAEKFITTLTNYCTYLPCEKVLPKNSLLFSEYCLRNEIFSINIDGKFLDAKVRNDLFDRFCEGKNSMTEKELKNWLAIEEQINVLTKKINGFQGDEKFACNMKSYNDFKKILGKVDESNYKDIEKMIYYLTVYNDKKIIRRRLKQEFDYLSQAEISAISNLKYSGWGSLSRRLLDGISIEENGRMVTIIDKMRTGRFNFMQIINEKNFKKAIEEEAHYNLDEDINDTIESLAGSPAIKKGIRQSLLIVNEIISIMGFVPDNIFVEFAREDQESSRKSTRQKKLLKAYEKYKDNPDFKETYDFIKNSNEKDFDDRMIYLYCLQNGKSLYSGKKLDISSLSQTCQIDHILPRCYIKDDSFDNLALVLSNENQRKKDSMLLDDEIIRSQYGRWNDLKSAGLISFKKFDNLVRKEIKKQDAKHFINRQLVETRQITKHVANLLKEIYSPQGTAVVQVKAGLTSDLRKRFSLYKNREINDYHHAHDAFLACQIGIFTQVCYPGVYKEFDFTTAKRYFSLKNNECARENKYGFIIGRFDELFVDENGEVIWHGEEKVNQIVKCLNYKDCFISKKTEKQSGGFCKDTIYPAGSKEASIRIKKDMPVELYGGKTGTNESYSAVIEYTKGKKTVKKLVGIPIIVDTISQTNPDAVENYLTEQGYLNAKVLKSPICKYQKVIIDGNEYYISSSSEVHNAKQLILPAWVVKTISNPTIDDEPELSKIYDILTEKIDLFYQGYSSVNEKLKKLETKEKFDSLDFNNKVKVINQIIIMLHANASNANLKEIGLRDREGRKEKYNIDINKAIFVYSSPTGIFENRIAGADL